MGDVLGFHRQGVGGLGVHVVLDAALLHGLGGDDGDAHLLEGHRSGGLVHPGHIGAAAGVLHGGRSGPAGHAGGGNLGRLGEGVVAVGLGHGAAGHTGEGHGLVRLVNGPLDLNGLPAVAVLRVAARAGDGQGVLPRVGARQGAAKGIIRARLQLLPGLAQDGEHRHIGMVLLGGVILPDGVVDLHLKGADVLDLKGFRPRVLVVAHAGDGHGAGADILVLAVGHGVVRALDQGLVGLAVLDPGLGSDLAPGPGLGGDGVHRDGVGVHTLGVNGELLHHQAGVVVLALHLHRGLGVLRGGVGVVVPGEGVVRVLGQGGVLGARDGQRGLLSLAVVGHVGNGLRRHVGGRQGIGLDGDSGAAHLRIVALLDDLEVDRLAAFGLGYIGIGERGRAPLVGLLLQIALGVVDRGVRRVGHIHRDAVGVAVIDAVIARGGVLDGALGDLQGVGRLVRSVVAIGLQAGLDGEGALVILVCDGHRAGAAVNGHIAPCIRGTPLVESIGEGAGGLVIRSAHRVDAGDGQRIVHRIGGLDGYLTAGKAHAGHCLSYSKQVFHIIRIPCYMCSIKGHIGCVLAPGRFGIHSKGTKWGKGQLAGGHIEPGRSLAKYPIGYCDIGRVPFGGDRVLEVLTVGNLLVTGLFPGKDLLHLFDGKGSLAVVAGVLAPTVDGDPGAGLPGQVAGAGVGIVLPHSHIVAFGQRDAPLCHGKGGGMGRPIIGAPTCGVPVGAVAHRDGQVGVAQQGDHASISGHAAQPGAELRGVVVGAGAARGGAGDDAGGRVHPQPRGQAGGGPGALAIVIPGLGGLGPRRHGLPRLRVEGGGGHGDGIGGVGGGAQGKGGQLIVDGVVDAGNALILILKVPCLYSVQGIHQFQGGGTDICNMVRCDGKFQLHHRHVISGGNTPAVI